MAEPLAGSDVASGPSAVERPDSGSPDSDHDHFTELRALIVGPEQRHLAAIRDHVFDAAVQTREVARVLPDALAMRADDPQLAASLAPLVEDAITSSVHRNPQPLADALFPVMGPAIRKSIEHLLASMMEAFNRGVEQSLSWRALQWRITSWRTGTPFAEIVLLNTLEYRVEQLFLIHAESGLLLQHVSNTTGEDQDADQVSAMLTAIRDFVRDSFKMTGSDHLDAFRVGSLSVVVESGPYAILAGTVRGTVPHSVRVLLKQTIESLHLQHGTELKAFNGDAAPFARSRPTLERCMVSEVKAARRGVASRRWLAVGTIVLLALGTWTFFTVRERLRWRGYLERLSAEPGLVVLSSGRRDGKHVVTGLRDPLAIDPASLVASSLLDPATVVGQWAPYQALAPGFIAERATALLRPPAGVSLDFADGVLTAHGGPSDRWLLDAERLTPAIPGVARFTYDGAPLGERLRQQLAAISPLFLKGQATLLDGQLTRVAEARRLLDLLNERCRVMGMPCRVDVLGHTDNDGTDSANEPLSEARAAALLHLVESPPFDALTLAAVGVGSTMPATPGTTEADKELNRRASFRVAPIDEIAHGRRP